MTTITKTERIARWICESRSIVAFTGAGVSTESGIPDFRSPGGIWSTSQPVYFQQFLSSAEARYEYWRQKSVAHRDFANSTPNAGHVILARWEDAGRLDCVITQNIDGLHQLAGSRQVMELHGTAREVMCLDCHARFDADPFVQQFLATNAVPACPACDDGRLKHATISFGQSLDRQTLELAMTHCSHTELLIALGSSLLVEPAASLPLMAKRQGSRLVIINRDSTRHDMIADAVIHASIGETLTAIDQYVRDFPLGS